ncbi:MAG: hypothetical protein EA338_06065 [Roseinatronobacter sp.]|nr:MAG: hypothetical protein EA338_06065 [Roseinatronobacter sp.]
MTERCATVGANLEGDCEFNIAVILVPAPKGQSNLHQTHELMIAMRPCLARRSTIIRLKSFA